MKLLIFIYIQTIQATYFNIFLYMTIYFIFINKKIMIEIQVKYNIRITHHNNNIKNNCILIVEYFA